jgi:catecholate siderophore receptor
VPVTNNALLAYRDQPAPVPRNTFYGLKDRDAEKLRSDFGTITFEHDFGDSMFLRSQVRYGRSKRDSLATPPRFANNSSTAINRELRSWITEDDIWDSQTDLRKSFSTGPLDHTVVAGLALTRETNLRQNRTGPNMLTTLFNPNPDDVYTGVITLSPIIGKVTGNSVAAYAFDTARLGRHWEVTGGLRWDRFAAAGINTSAAIVKRTDRMLSGRIGLVYKPQEHGSIYASFGTSVNPSLEGLSYGTANTAIDPEKTYSFEMGSKWDLFKERLSLTGAIFSVDKNNARTPGLLPDDPPQVLDGKQRVAGLELGVGGSIIRNWQVFAGYTYLNSEIVSSHTPAEVGNQIQNTPPHSLNLWSTYVWHRLTVGGGPRFVDRRFGNNINTRHVDSYWLVDALVSYRIKEQIDVRLNMYNLADKFYFDRLGGGHVIPGPGRAAQLSTTFHF